VINEREKYLARNARSSSIASRQKSNITVSLNQNIQANLYQTIPSINKNNNSTKNFIDSNDKNHQLLLNESLIKNSEHESDALCHNNNNELNLKNNDNNNSNNSNSNDDRSRYYKCVKFFDSNNKIFSLLKYKKSGN
jgi:hypothetical protein